MKPIKSVTSACRYCRHFQPEGRRGGMCQQLSAPVQGTWKACSLALPPFAPPWETLEDAWSLPVATPVLSSSHSLSTNLDNIALAPVEEIVIITSQETQVQPVFI
jgi:hypothetical protein